MNVLAIDTSVGVSVAILRSNGEVTQSQPVDHGMQGELTAGLISQLVIDSGLEIHEITDVVVGVGPGLYRLVVFDGAPRRTGLGGRLVTTLGHPGGDRWDGGGAGLAAIELVFYFALLICAVFPAVLCWPAKT